MKKTGLAFKSWFTEAAENSAGKRIGFDPLLISTEAIEARTKFFAKSNVEFVPIDQNLVDAIWGEAQPVNSMDQIFRHDDIYVGQTASDKIENIG